MVVNSPLKMTASHHQNWRHLVSGLGEKDFIKIDFFVNQDHRVLGYESTPKHKKKMQRNISFYLREGLKHRNNCETALLAKKCFIERKALLKKKGFIERNAFLKEKLY